MKELAKMAVIALSGWKQSGKDSLADYLVANYGAVRVAFADPLKDMVAREYGVNRTHLDSPEFKEKPILSMPVRPQDAFSRNIAEFMYKELRDERGRQPVKYVTGDRFFGIFSDAGQAQLYWTPRALAILKGSVNRSVDSAYWVKTAIEEIKMRRDSFQQELVVVTDLRYKSEAAQLASAFGDALKIIRIDRFDSSPSSDPSERDMDDYPFNFIVRNRGTREEAYAQLEQILGLEAFQQVVS